MKWVKYVEYVLFIITIVCFASLFFLPQVQHMGDMHADCEWMMWWMYGIVIIGVIAALISPVKNLFTSPKSALTTLVGLVVAALVIGGCWMISSAAPVPNSAGGFFEDVFDLKFTDTILYVTYLVGGISILSILVGEIRNAIK
ncbi:MAG: hypothetical protein IJY45_06205 [Tidjanibacter sp.]|nr:hypothetical protein [Rikenellaceae bacterium]MBQ8335746.1 hypothetical protein [Tidjanibacter sp.]